MTDVEMYAMERTAELERLAANANALIKAMERLNARIEKEKKQTAYQRVSLGTHNARDFEAIFMNIMRRLAAVEVAEAKIEALCFAEMEK